MASAIETPVSETHARDQFAPPVPALPVPDRALPIQDQPVLDLTAQTAWAWRYRTAWADLTGGLALWRLFCTLGWLDIRLRYRGSVLGPFWLTLSTAVMVAALGVLYSQLFRMNIHEYLPYLALSLVLWNALASIVTDGCAAFTASEGTIRSIRMPYSLYAYRILVRNLLTLAHNIVVIVAVDAIFSAWPGWAALLAIPGLGLWLFDAIAIALLLGAFCARFRDIPPIVASVMQIAFFVSPVIWKPELLHGRAMALLPFNPFFSLLEVVRGPMLGQVPSLAIWASAAAYSAVLGGLAWVLFARIRNRLAFWA